MADAGVVDAGADAARLVDAFGSFPQVLVARPAQIEREVKDRRALAAIIGFRQAMEYALLASISERPVLTNSRLLRDYLRFAMAGDTVEVMRVLYLTSNNHLIRDEILAVGTLDQAPIYAREIVHRALELGAANLVLAHNHPSGDKTPSEADIRITRRLMTITQGLDLAVLDHLVVGRDGVTSMRGEGLL